VGERHEDITGRRETDVWDPWHGRTNASVSVDRRRGEGARVEGGGRGEAMKGVGESKAIEVVWLK